MTGRPIVSLERRRDRRAATRLHHGGERLEHRAVVERGRCRGFDRVAERLQQLRRVLGRGDALGVDFREAERRGRAHADAQLARVGADLVARTAARAAARVYQSPVM